MYSQTALKKEANPQKKTTVENAYEQFTQDKAARRIQNGLRMWGKTPEQRLFKKIEKPRRVLYSEDIRQRFTLDPNYPEEGVLGGGGHAVVLKVFDNETQTHKAYKVGDSGMLQSLEHVVNFLLDHSYTLHLTRLEGAFISRSWGLTGFGFPFKYPQFALVKPALSEEELERLDPKTRQDIYAYDSPSYPLQNCHITLMEVLEGSLRKDGYTLAQRIQLETTLNMLRKVFGFIEHDQKPKNVFFKRLTEDDFFKGQRLMDFDFWHYRLGNDHFYIPRQEVIVKLGDYDGWSCSLGDITEEKMSALIKQIPRYDAEGVRRFNLRQEMLDEAKVLFKKPENAHAKILDMMPEVDRYEISHRDDVDEAESVLGLRL